jgi:pimeloyl-ACP methyl ester carboxylesterase
MRPSSYATLRRRAEQRLSSIEHPTIASPFGTIEYAERGEGDPVLVLHGIFGGFDAAYLTVDPWIGDGFHVVAPSRFGCLGSSLPPNTTVADQADAYAELLDALGIEQAAVVGFSAGTVSAMQFGLRHPGRTTALVLMSGHYPQKHHKLPGLPLRLLYTDRVFWALKRFTPELLGRICGTPKGFRASPAEQQALEWVIDGLFPIGARARGAIFDTLVSEPEVDDFPLEQLSVPTLMIHAADDALARYATAPPAAARIPRARLVTIDRGGHLYLGAEARVRRELAAFIRSHVAQGAGLPVPTARTSGPPEGKRSRCEGEPRR